MTSPEKTNISKAAEQMTFAADFDHNLSDQEKRKAAEKLNDLIKSTLKRFPDHVDDLSRPDTYESMDMSMDMDKYLSLLLQVPQEDGSSVTINIKSTGIGSGRISITEFRGYGVGECHRYSTEGGQVLRSDDDLSESERIGLLPVLVSVLERKRTSLQEERDRGINYQPVGVDEIDKLAELLKSAVPYK